MGRRWEMCNAVAVVREVIDYRDRTRVRSSDTRHHWQKLLASLIGGPNRIPGGLCVCAQQWLVTSLLKTSSVRELPNHYLPCLAPAAHEYDDTIRCVRVLLRLDTSLLLMSRWRYAFS
jgi:hypothetical protein